MDLEGQVVGEGRWGRGTLCHSLPLVLLVLEILLVLEALSGQYNL